jgi:peptide/nickel transport system ATP-binding protein
VGCPFAPRCPHAMDICRTVMPALTPGKNSSGAVKVACHWVQAMDATEEKVMVRE